MHSNARVSLVECDSLRRYYFAFFNLFEAAVILFGCNRPDYGEALVSWVQPNLCLMGLYYHLRNPKPLMTTAGRPEHHLHTPPETGRLVEDRHQC